MGNPHHAPLGVYLSYQAAMFIETYLQANPVNEMAGFLVGYVFQNQKRPFIMITGAIEAPDVIRIDGGLQFAQKTWEYLKSVWQREYPDTVVLGWFHSQPGRGLALSAVNRFTHQRFFQRPWQVSFVVDPLQNTSRFYRHAGRKLVPLEDFYLFDPDANAPSLAHLKEIPHENEPATAEQESAATAEHRMPPPVHPPQRVHRWHGLGILLLLFAVLILTWSVQRIAGQLPSLRQAATHLSHIEAQIAEARSEQQRLEALVHQLKQVANINHSAETSSTGQASSTPPRADDALKPGAAADPYAAGGAIAGMDGTFGFYVVQPGDTLWKISQIALGTPYAYTRLAELNQLADPDRIFPGMVLRLPETADGL